VTLTLSLFQETSTNFSVPNDMHLMFRRRRSHASCSAWSRRWVSLRKGATAETVATDLRLQDLQQPRQSLWGGMRFIVGG
jgi:hypothetical protein